MNNKENKNYTIESIYEEIESVIPKNFTIKEYALPNARQWLGGRYFALWVIPIFLIKKILNLASSLSVFKPYSPSYNEPNYTKPETLYTTLKNVFNGPDKIRFFDHRFIGIWVFPFVLTGIVFEILFISPLNNISTFN